MPPKRTAWDRTLDQILGPISDGDEEPQPAPKKQRKKRGKGAKNSMFKFVSHILVLTTHLPLIIAATVKEADAEQLEADTDDVAASGDDNPVPAPIAYTISIFTLSQMAKDPKKRGDGKTVLMEIGADLVWDTWKAQLLVKISTVLKPAKILFDDYEVTFSIPRIHPKATALSDDSSYKFMVTRASKGKDRSVSIVVEPVIPEKASVFLWF